MIKKEILGRKKLARVGDSDKVNLGESIITFDNALGHGQSVNSGIISALNRNVNSKEIRCIQIDSAINPGNSGGALFNFDGELIWYSGCKKYGLQCRKYWVSNTY